MMQQILLRGQSTIINHTVSVPDTAVLLANGAQDFQITATVSNGSGSFTYAWVWDSGGSGMTISNATAQTCTITSTATDFINFGVIKCTVVDTGNGNLSVADTGNVTAEHGSPP